VKDPRNGEELYWSFDVPAAEVAKSHGLAAQAGGVEVPNAPLEWPISGAPAGANGARFRGSLFIPSDGMWKLYGTGQGSLSLRLQGQTVGGMGAASAREKRLAMGLYPFEADYRAVPGAKMQVMLEGRPGRSAVFLNLRSTAAEALGTRLLFPHIRPQGFFSQYYLISKREAQRVEDLLEGEPASEMVEPFLMSNWLDAPLPGSWGARFRARLKVDQAGVYEFRSPNVGFTEVRVDGRLVFRGGQAPVPLAPGDLPQTQPQLSSGWHDLQVVFATGGHPWINLTWIRPGGKEEAISPAQLEPVYPKE
jgi:hypothetical protein